MFLTISKKIPKSQVGFSLVELMVGLLLGLLATIAIMQVFSVFEGQKRTTTGSADAQTNGSIALFTMQRDIQMAGYGLPVFDTANPPLKCDPSPTVNLTTATTVDMFPVQIQDGGAGLSDTIRVRYAPDGVNATGGVAEKIILASSGTSTVSVDNNLSCNNGDMVFISNGTSCAMTKVNDTDLATDTTHITLSTFPATQAVAGASISCMGKWTQYTYRVTSNNNNQFQLERNDGDAATATAIPIVSEIVNIQAQYGVSATANSNQVTQWVEPTGIWATPSVANRNRIKAVHIAVVARNGLLEKTNVTPAAPITWNGGPTVDLSGDANWQQYRYRVYDTIVPIRNMIWSINTL